MQDIRNSFNEQVQHIDYYMQLLLDIENGAQLSIIGQTKNIHADLFKVLKANTFLLLYNLIESTVRKSIEHLHISFNTDLLKYIEAIEEIQKMWVEYQYKKFREMNIDNMFETWTTMLDDIIVIEYADYDNRTG